MKKSLYLCAALIALLPLSGCEKKVVIAPPPPPPPTLAVSVPPPTHPTEPLPQMATITSEPLPIPEEPAKRPPPRRRQQASPPAEQTAAVTVPISDLGELTTGGESDNDSLRREAQDLIRSQSRRLSGLPVAVVSSHKHQVDQVRLFLRQASESWSKQDIEGARVLATKAKVLLDEIQG